MKILIVLVALFVSACASAVEPDAVAPVEVAPPSVPEVPRHTFSETSPAAAFGALPSWSVDPDSCASPRFVRGDQQPGGTAFVTDSTTGLTWGAAEALAFTPAGTFDAVAFANALCASEYSGTRAATQAEIDAVAKAVPNCPLPGAFYSVDLWRMMTGDAKCIDLKTDTASGTAEDCASVPGGDVSRAALCVK